MPAAGGRRAGGLCGSKVTTGRTKLQVRRTARPCPVGVWRPRPGCGTMRTEQGRSGWRQTDCHTPSVGLSSSQAEPRRYQEDVTEMRHQEPLRISCDGCPGGCDNCLVEFFTAEREAQVVRLGGEDAADAKAASTAATQRPLDPDLDRALATLIAAGLHPELLAVRPASVKTTPIEPSGSLVGTGATLAPSNTTVISAPQRRASLRQRSSSRVR